MAVAAPATETTATVENAAAELAVGAGLAKLSIMSKDDWRWFFRASIYLVPRYAKVPRSPTPTAVRTPKRSDVAEGLFSVQECSYRCLPVIRVLCGTERR
ncbi:hypothetical protein Tco_0671852 [Tanacetum coccineum]